MVQERHNPAPPKRRPAAAWGMVLGCSGVAFAIVRNIVLIPIYLRFMTIAEYGAWLATGAVVVQWLVTDFGLAGVLMQRSSVLHGAGESSQLGAIIGSGLLTGLALAAILALLGLAAIPWLPAMAGLTAAQGASVHYCLDIAVLAAAAGIVGAIAQGLVRSLQFAAVAGSLALLADVASVATTVICLQAGAGLAALPYGLLTRSALVVVGEVGYLVILGRTEFSLSLSLQMHTLREIFSDAWTSFISSFAMKAQTQANTFMVGAILGPTSAAVYGLTVRAHETVLLFLGQLNGAFAPSMAHLWGSGNRTRFRELILRIAVAGTSLTALGMCVIVVVNEDFLRLWTGSRVFAGQLTSVLMAVAILVSAVGYVAYDALYALGRFHIIARTYVLAAAVHLITLVCLLRFGLWAAPLATLVSALLWGGLFWNILRREIKLQVTDLGILSANVLVIGICAAAVAAAFLTFVRSPDSWPGLLGTAALTVTVLAGALLLNRRIRVIAQIEAVMTLRALIARHQS